MDIQKIKDRLNQLQQTTTSSNSFWKPQPGKTQIRMVPYKFNKDNPFIELYFHYSMGDNKTHLSPISFGRPDPINEFASKLKSTGDRDEWIQGRKLEPKMRTFVPMVARGQEHEGIKFWGFGKTVYQELLGFIADPITGRDIVVERQTPAEAGNQYGKTTIRVKPNQLPLTEDKDVLTKMFDSQVDIKEIYTEPTYEELKELLKSYLSPDNNEEPSESSQTSTSTTKTNTSAVSDVEDAFDQLFNS